MTSLLCRHILRAFVLLAGAVLLFLGRPALAQEFPAKHVTFHVGFAAGGATDVAARALGKEMSALWKREVVVQNRPGAGGVLAASSVARLPPDGYNLLFTTQALPVSSLLSKQLTYDPLEDFIPIAKIGEVTLVLVVNSKLPINSVEEFVDYARQHPGELNASSGGVGSATHLAIEQFALTAGIDIVHVPYGGTAAAIADLVSGNISFTFDSLPALLPHIRSGKLRALAVGSGSRAPVLPDTPTVAESGFPGYESSSWFALLGPSGMPDELVQKIHLDADKAMQSQDFQSSLNALGITSLRSDSPAELKAYMKSEQEKYSDIVKRAGITVQ